MASQNDPIEIKPDTIPVLKYDELVQASGTNGMVSNGNTTTPIANDFQSPNFKTNVSGWRLSSNGNIEANDGTFRGTLEAGVIHIGGNDATSAHIDNDGNFWTGANNTGFAGAPAKISNAGAATFNNITITGGSLTGTTTVGIGNVNIAARGWTQTCVFSVTDADTVAWAAGSFISADGTTYSIGGGNTGNMAAATYIYLDVAVSTTAYQTTTTAATAVGAGKVLIAKAQNGSGEATFETFGGIGGTNINASSIVANSITANELSTSITYAGTIIIDTSGHIRSGQTAYNTGTGWFLGNDGGTPKLSIGNSSGNRVTWDGTSLTVVGVVSNVQEFSADGTWTKPGGGQIAYVEVWGAGGSGGVGASGGSNGQGAGGGGGAYSSKWILLSGLTSTVAVTVGTGGAAVSGAAQSGNIGEDSSFGAYVVAYGGGGGGYQSTGDSAGGGGGGGGTASAGTTGADSTTGADGGNIGGGTGGAATAAGTSSTAGGGGGGGGGTTTGGNGGGSFTGGGGGGGGGDNGQAGHGGTSYYGGGGGGGSDRGGANGNGGDSIHGGDGGAGGNSGTAGTIPGGGGGGAFNGTSGAGANGFVRVTVI